MIGLFLFAGIVVFFLFQFYIKVPKLTLNQIQQSFTKGQHISQYFDKDSLLTQNILQFSNDGEIQFYTKKNKPCLKIKISSENAIIKNQRSDWNGSIESLSEYLLTHRTKLDFCDYTCPKFIFNNFISGSICVYLDKVGNITKVDSPLVWNF